MTIKGVVFDCFGTLMRISDPTNAFDSLCNMVYENHDTAQRAGQLIPILPHIRRQMIMSHNVGLADTALMLGKQLTLYQLVTLQRDLEKELASVRLLPMADFALRGIQSQELRIGICSNLAAPFRVPVELLLAPYQIRTFTYSCEHGHVKPDSRIYETTKYRMGLQPQEILFVGDSFRNDVQGPDLYGMKSVLLRPSDDKTTVVRHNTTMGSYWATGCISNIPEFVRKMNESPDLDELHQLAF